ncbi:MAG: trypsin-like peptidase domain-containing protein [Herpetosiphonaceae bacterium]|nr:trypsin-like peptidase domain-containing protein [Herpetosiphonaceae bacterium]
MQNTIQAPDAMREFADLAAASQRNVVLVKSGQRGMGSGVVWRSDGLILTNHHVVAGHAQAQVVLHDDRELTATVLATDPTLDLGVLQVDATNLTVATIRTTPALRVGELVMAIGNPWGQRGVVTLGIASGVGEVQVPWRPQTAAYVRSDVQLAPGNSGGPMVDMQGRVVGINAMIMGGDLSVAIPSSVVTQFLQVVEGRPLLGVGVRPIPLPVPVAARAGQAQALEVLDVVPGGAAARAGCQVGDLLLTLDDAQLTDAGTLRAALGQHPIGKRVRLRRMRDGKPSTVLVELAGVGVQTV